MKYTRGDLVKKYADSDLNTLLTIDLMDCQITELDENVFKGLENLCYINLHNNELEKIHSDTFNGLKSVISIRIYQNKLNFLHKDIFKGLNNLIKLSINNNYFREIDKDLFKGLNNLITLNLSDNKLEHLDKAVFNGLTSLSKLTISRNQLISIGMNLFSQLISLQTLSLNSNSLTELHEYVFSELESLKCIHLFNNNLNRLSPNIFRGLVHLVEIDLYNNQLEEIHQDTFKDLVNLNIIGMGFNKLKDIPVELFNGLKSIKTISLDYNQIKSLNKNVFKGLFSLERIQIAGNLFQNENSLELNLENNVTFVSFRQKWNENNIDSIIQIQPVRSSLSVLDEHRPKQHFFFKNVYKQIKFLGEGSFGRVYQVENIRNNKQYALKVVLSKLSLGSQETKLLAELKSPYLIEFVEWFFETADFYCIVTEYCQGGDLARQIEIKRKNKKKFSLNSVSLWALEMIYGIEYLHRKNVVHRDLKPGNIFLNNGHIKLGDLGSATHKSTLSSSLKTHVGTPIYMSPEIIRYDSYDFKTDVWSTGLILFELFTLEFPFRGDSNFSIQESILRDDLPDLIFSLQFNFLLKL